MISTVTKATCSVMRTGFANASSSPTFADDLDGALRTTGATLVFDAIGGGRLTGVVLAAMERVASADTSGYSRYGSTTFKQAYIYGGLDRGPTVIDRTFGMAWSIGGWLLPNFLATIEPARADEMRRRVADEITTTFASEYSSSISLDGALDPDAFWPFVDTIGGSRWPGKMGGPKR